MTRMAILLIAMMVIPGRLGSQTVGPDWETITPGGRTGCGFETPFEFWVRPGDPSRTWGPEFLTASTGSGPLADAIGRDLASPPCDIRRRAERGGTAAFLFSYRIIPGMERDFFDGYRRHLEWHRSRADSLSWLGWTVVDGPGLGRFVDGAFGIPHRAFDERVDPAGDGADAARNVTAYATPVGRELHRLRPELGSATRLERGEPGAMQKVTRL